MSLALTVFGIAAQGSNSVFCYAFLCDVRGTGAYPKPNLPKKQSARWDNTSSHRNI
jgi:hypothetical protein